MQIDDKDVQVGDIWVISVSYDNRFSWSSLRAAKVTRIGKNTVSLGGVGNAATGNEPVYYHQHVRFIELVNRKEESNP